MFEAEINNCFINNLIKHNYNYNNYKTLLTKYMSDLEINSKRRLKEIKPPQIMSFESIA
jgi:hypothetical protein